VHNEYVDPLGVCPANDDIHTAFLKDPWGNPTTTYTGSTSITYAEYGSSFQVTNGYAQIVKMEFCTFGLF